MTVIPRFLSSMQQFTSVVADDSWSMTTRAAMAVVEVVPGVEGAVVCLTQDLGMRAPVGYSDAEALLAEQLEYTVGAGPGHEAQRRRRHVSAGHDLARRWPVLNDVLLGGTGYRAVRALPLLGDTASDHCGVLLLLYGTVGDVDLVAHGDRLEMAQLSLLVGRALVNSADRATADSRVGVTPRIHPRAAVAQAVGMVMAAHHLSTSDALALLRGYAYARGEIVDDTSADLVHRRVPLHLLG